MQLFIGGYGYRYNDFMSTFVGFKKEDVEKAIEDGCKWEEEEMPSYCEHGDELCDDDCEDCNGSECAFCHPDLVTGGVWEINHVSDLGGLKRAKEIIRNMRDGNGITSLEY